MGVPYRKSIKATGCSVADPTTITLNAASGMTTDDKQFCLTIIPTGAGTGTLGVTWACGDFDTDFMQAYDANGAAISISLAAASSVTISGVDLYKLKLTPSAISGVTAYSYSLAAVG